ncbi:MAG: chemotaxis protein CheD [Rhizomicrobium sp.]
MTGYGTTSTARTGPPGEPRRFLNSQDGNWHVQITQGDCYVTDDPREVLTTILGSCIAVCLRDPVAGIGGMNHFLLPEGEGTDRDAQRYGVNAMEVLINAILKRGGSRQRLEAKVFGGANVVVALSDVGSRNVQFAKQFLANEGITVRGGDVGGASARRIQFWPVDGRARQLAMVDDAKRLVEKEVLDARMDGSRTAVSSDVELF